MTDSQRQQCTSIIHSAAVSAAAGVGAGIAQIPMSDAATILPIHVAMIMQLARVFNEEISEATARGMALSTLSTLFVGRAVSQVFLGWIPALGNAIKASSAAAVTEVVGWAIASRFDLGPVIDPLVLRQAEEAFGPDVAMKWLRSQCAAISDLRPIDLLGTTQGRKQVLDVLNCIAHGFVY